MPTDNSPANAKVSNEKPSASKKISSSDVHVPSPDQYRMSREMEVIYSKTQSDLNSAIKTLGIQEGVSAVLSGVTRELRRHLTAEACQELLRGFADSIPGVSRFDDDNGRGSENGRGT